MFCRGAMCYYLSFPSITALGLFHAKPYGRVLVEFIAASSTDVWCTCRCWLRILHDPEQGHTVAICGMRHFTACPRGFHLLSQRALTVCPTLAFALTCCLCICTASDPDDDQGSSAALQEGSDGAGAKSASPEPTVDALITNFGMIERFDVSEPSRAIF